MVAELLRLWKKVGDERLIEEQWRGAAFGILQRYTNLFMGIG
jgi:hypothetical protein